MATIKHVIEFSKAEQAGYRETALSLALLAGVLEEGDMALINESKKEIITKENLSYCVDILCRLSKNEWTVNEW